MLTLKALTITQTDDIWIFYLISEKTNFEISYEVKQTIHMKYKKRMFSLKNKKNKTI